MTDAGQGHSSHATATPTVLSAVPAGAKGRRRKWNKTTNRAHNKTGSALQTNNGSGRAKPAGAGTAGRLVARRQKWGVRAGGWCARRRFGCGKIQQGQGRKTREEPLLSTQSKRALVGRMPWGERMFSAASRDLHPMRPPAAAPQSRPAAACGTVHALGTPVRGAAGGAGLHSALPSQRARLRRVVPSAGADSWAAKPENTSGLACCSTAMWHCRWRAGGRVVRPRAGVHGSTRGCSTTAPRPHHKPARSAAVPQLLPRALQCAGADAP